MTRVRVMTYNILRGGSRGEPLTEAVRRAGVDVLLVNEAPKTPIIWRWRCRRLCARWGLRYVVGGRSAGSNLIAVAAHVDVASASALVVPQPWFRPRRGVASAQLRVHGSALAVVSCHLSLDRDSRVDEVETVVAAAERLPGTVVVAGDLNERPTGPSWRRLVGAGYLDLGNDEWPTFPADTPETRIDALLVRGAADVAEHGSPGLPEELLAAASDHRPVLAALNL